MVKRNQLNLFVFSIVLMTFCLSIPPGSRAQETEAQGASPLQSTKIKEQADEQDQTLFFAFLGEDPQALQGPFVRYLKDKPILKDIISPQNPLERKFRPMLQWRRWADKTHRFMPSFLFIAFISTLCWSFFPLKMQAAAEESKKSFWKSFATGLLIAAVTMLTTRAVFLSELGWPLGILIAGLSQAAMLIGLSLTIYNLGHSILLILHLNKIPALAQNAACHRICDLIAGSLLAALLLQIPSIGLLPRPGSRLLAFFALLGIGAIYRELKAKQ